MVADWVKKYISEEEVLRVSNAVTLAEKNSDGEIVPMIVRSSSFYGHLPLVLTLLITIFFLILELPYLFEVGSWNWIWPFLIFVIYIISQKLASYPVIINLFSIKADSASQVMIRAELEFFKARLQHTQRRTGVLIFVSLLERQAVILGDDAINQKISQKEWDKLLTTLISAIKNNRMGDGFEKAIEMAGTILKTHFPLDESGNSNELLNHLIIKE